MAPLDVKPNELEPYWIPFTANRAFKKRPRLFARRQGHALLQARRHQGDRRHVGPVLRQRRPLPRADRQGHPGDGGQARLFAGLPVRPSQGVRAGLAARPAGPRRPRLRLLLQLGLARRSIPRSRSRSAYHKAKGEGARTRFIGRERGYHGIGFGGISVGGMVANRKQFGNMLTGVDHLQSTYNRAEQAFTKGEPEWGAHLADELTRLINLHDASTIAAVIVEPVAGSTGILPPPKGYLKKLREITAQHGILLIFDEVITGFGRLGHCFASERYGVDAGHDHLRQGRHQRRRADGGRDGVQEDLRRLHDRPRARGGAVPRLHLLGPSAGGRRRPRHARHLQGRGPVRARHRSWSPCSPTP